MLAQLLRPRSLEPPLEVLLVGVDVGIFEFDLAPPIGQISALGVDLNNPLLSGWRESHGSSKRRVGVTGKFVAGGELLRCLVPQPRGIPFGGLECRVNRS